jgi:hypothetical protein
VAEVWHGTDVELARPVAVKLLHAEAGDADSITRFPAAACRSASLTHEGLVRVFDYCEPESPASAQHPFLIMSGDVRPEKILLTREGTAKLFGFSDAGPIGSAAIGGDLAALGLVARDCPVERTSAGGSGPPSAQVPDPLAELVAELCTSGSADQPDATAAIARRAAALRTQLGRVRASALAMS